MGRIDLILNRQRAAGIRHQYGNVPHIAEKHHQQDIAHLVERQFYPHRMLLSGIAPHVYPKRIYTYLVGGVNDG